MDLSGSTLSRTEENPDGLSRKPHNQEIICLKNTGCSPQKVLVINLVYKKMAFVAGGGKYGSGALKFFLKTPEWKTVICDENENCEASHLVKTSTKLSGLNDVQEITEPRLIIGDAVETLTQLLLQGIVPEVVVPCVPFHFAAKVLTSYLANRTLSVRPLVEPLKEAFEKSQLQGIEYRIDERHALAVASKMPFDLRCAAGCIQPQKCPVTKKELRKPMYDLVAELLKLSKVEFVKVLRSHLLSPNVGGFSGEELKQSLDFSVTNKPRTLALATSCSCHAVMNVFRIED
jgi:hypothetical protein